VIWTTTLHVGNASFSTCRFHWSPTTLEENTTNIYEPIVLQNTRADGNSMYIFTQIGFLRNTCINTKEIVIESQFDFKLTVGLHRARKKHNGIMHVTCDRSESPLNELISTTKKTRRSSSSGGYRPPPSVVSPPSRGFASAPAPLGRAPPPPLSWLSIPRRPPEA